MALPDICDGGFAHTLADGHQPATPMSRILRLALQRGVQDRFNAFAAIGRLSSPSRSNLPETGAALLPEPLVPQTDCFAINLQRRAHSRLGLAIGQRQDDTATQGDLLRGAKCGHPTFELSPLLRSEVNRNAGA